VEFFSFTDHFALFSHPVGGFIVHSVKPSIFTNVDNDLYTPAFYVESHYRKVKRCLVEVERQYQVVLKPNKGIVPSMLQIEKDYSTDKRPAQSPYDIITGGKLNVLKVTISCPDKSHTAGLITRHRSWIELRTSKYKVLLRMYRGFSGHYHVFNADNKPLN